MFNQTMNHLRCLKTLREAEAGLVEVLVVAPLDERPHPMPGICSALSLLSSKDTERELEQRTGLQKQWGSRMLIFWVSTVFARGSLWCKCPSPLTVFGTLALLSLVFCCCAHGYQSGLITRSVAPQNKLICRWFLQMLIVLAIHQSLFPSCSSLSTDCGVHYSKWACLHLRGAPKSLSVWGIYCTHIGKKFSTPIQ